MKKLIAILMAASMLLAASACGNNENSANTPETSDSITNVKACTDIYNEDIATVIKMPEMISVSEKKLNNTYGIEKGLYNDYVFMTAQEATKADTVIIIKASSEDNKEDITDKLNTFIEQCMNTSVDYNPEQFELVKQASVKENGDYVYLVFSEDMDTIEEIIKGAIA